MKTNKIVTLKLATLADCLGTSCLLPDFQRCACYRLCYLDFKDTPVPYFPNFS